MNKQNESLYKHARAADRAMTGVFGAVGLFMVAFLILLTGYIIINGFRGFMPEMLSTGQNGILNQLFNTVYLVVLSLLISVPLGIGAGVYLAEYSRPGKLLDFLEISIESLSSLPSIVIGLFGYLVFILMTGMKWNLFAGALAVSILSLPLITTETNSAIRSLPPEYKEGSLATGATLAQTIRHVLIPAAMPQILTGVIMAAGRGFGEAAALLYTSGQSTVINWSNWNITSPTCPLNPFRAGETLSLHIWVLRTEGSLNANSEAIAGFASAVLVILTLCVSVITRRLSDSIRNRNQKGK
ncbi:MAG: phosphate ABC transporter permease PstA [Lactimicrobium sp.]|jgi:phosphate transport system permease protein|uniref:phosphate ABC transporter permease PstA n=1 Tax=Lactimicrobium sp. TaxID=2563780 RepID=UPI002F35A1B3